VDASQAGATISSTFLQGQRRRAGAVFHQLDLQLLEAPLLRWEGRQLRLTSTRILPLVAYVVLAPGSVTRRELVRLLWDDGQLVNLRQELAKIRRLPGSERWFEADPDSGRVLIRASSDLARVRAAFDSADHAFIVDKFAAVPGLSVLNGYDTDFLPPAFHEWLEQENSQLQELLIESFQLHAREQEAAGNLLGAVSTYRQLVSLDPFLESAHRAIMRLEIAAGRPEVAHQQLDRAKAIFRREFKVEPSSETLELEQELASLRSRKPTGRRARQPLPMPKTPFIGRERELTGLGQLLADQKPRVVTITGLGGVGKSRLALEFAHRHSPQFADGAAFLSLAGTEQADLVPAGLAGTLGLSVDGETYREHVLDHLQGRAYLLVFDNTEQLPLVGEFIDSLIERSPASQVLITSRVPLGLQAERIFPLQGLNLPPTDDDSLAASDAVRLFRQSVHRQLEAGHLAQAALICRQLDGLPLGIELAASLVHYLSFDEIIQELNQGNYGLLSAEHVDRPHRHQALSTLLEATWQSLEAEAQAQLARLSVFEGAFSRADAREVTGLTVEEVRHLVDRSLLTYDPATGLLAMHNVVRWFAADQLLALPRGQAVRRRLHLRAAERIRGRQQDTAPRTLDDLTPWLEAVQHLIQAEQFDDACRFLNSFDVRLLLRWGQARSVLELHQQLYPQLQDTELKGRSQNSMGLALGRLGRLPEAIQAYQLALSHSRETEDAANEANYLGNLGIAYSVSGRLSEAIELHLQSIDISRRLGNRRNEGIDLGCVGLAYNRLGNVDKAIEFHELALLASQEAGDRHNEANHLGNLARIYSARGELVHALAYVRASLTLRRALADRRGEALDLHCLAEIHQQQGDSVEAEAVFRSALAQYRSISEHIGESETQFALARLLHTMDRQQEALANTRAALTLSRSAGDRHTESELLIWLGEQYLADGHADTAAALWLTARSVLPEKSSELGVRVDSLLVELGLLADPAGVKRILRTGSELLLRATGVTYALPHLELLEFGAPA